MSNSGFADQQRRRVIAQAQAGRMLDGERAIHGWTDVPTYAASHGCVRIPYWITLWMFDQDPIGTPVYVYH